MRRFFTIILILILITTGIYLFFAFRKDSEEKPGAGNGAGNELFPLFENTNESGESKININENIEEKNLEDENGPELSQQVPGSLTQLTEVPVSGFFAEDDYIRYVERETGHIYELTGTSTQKLTNTTIPRVQNAVWINKNTVFLQYLKENTDTIETFLGKLPSATSTDQLGGFFLRQNITSISPGPDKKTVFYILKEEGGSKGILYNTQNNSELVVLDTPLREIASSWSRENAITINTKPSYRSFGYSFSLDKTGNLTDGLSNLVGLYTLPSPSDPSVLFSSRNTLYISRSDINENLGVKTLADKCAWGSAEYVYCAVPAFLPNEGSLPDSWYKGEVLFSDNLLKINTATKESEEIQVADNVFDATSLVVDKNGHYLLFINKRDQTLWMATL